MSASLPFNRATLLLLAGCLLLGVVIAAQLGMDAYQPPPPAPATTDPGEAGVADEASYPYMPPAIAMFDELLARPLFNAERSPPEEEASDTPADTTPSESGPEPQLVSGLQLEGVILTGPTQVAILRSLSDKELLRVAQGESFRGWQVEQVEAERVVFSNGPRTEELTLPMQVADPANGAADPVPGAARPLRRAGSTSRSRTRRNTVLAPAPQ